MAHRLDVDGNGVSYGYFYSYIFEEVDYYICELLNVFQQSFLATFHSSAMFINAAGQEKELHMPPLPPITFDPDSRTVQDDLRDVFDQLTNPEIFENIEGSGWAIIPDSYTFWVNTVQFQPNNNPTGSGTFDVDNDDYNNPDDPAYTEGLTQLCKDTFLLSIAAHHVKRSRHDTRLMYRNKCEDWLKNANLWMQNEKKVSLAWIAIWHENVYMYHIRIFSSHGNVLYHKWYPLNESEPVDCINILYKNNKFTYINNLYKLFREASDKVFCIKCNSFHRNELVCETHIEMASSTDMKVPEYPGVKHNLVCYADFESYIKNGKHNPSGIHFILIEAGTLIFECTISLDIYNDVPAAFIKLLIEALKNYINIEPHNVSKKCTICGSTTRKGDRIAGKNFIDGKEGWNCTHCWYDIRNTCYVFFHNFRGYDSHYVLFEAINHCDVKNIRGKSFEKFDLLHCVSNKVQFTFKDTYNFLPNSLAQLVPMVQTWQYTPPDFRNTKGIFPYDWFDSPEKLEYSALPPIEFWYNRLTDSTFDPSNAYTIWNTLGFTKFKQYHNHYMRIDVLQLADIFEEFRSNVYNEFTLDPVYCQGTPSLTWQLCIQDFHNRFGIIQDLDVYMDLQKNIRGGISQVMTRHKSIEQSGGSIIYFDVNSMYSYAMEQKLPSKFVCKMGTLPDDWEQVYCTNGEHTAIICVDLAYPNYLHDRDRFYPLAPHKFNSRLCTTLHEREQYLVHAKLLQFYLQKGMVIIKVHYVYVFKQDYILKDYVQNNINKRVQASRNNNIVATQLFKLLNNSLYGKTCENKFKYKTFNVRNKRETQYGKVNSFLRSATNFIEVNDKVLYETKNRKIKLDKPIQIGFTVLEFAKLIIYDFIYAILEVFPTCELLYTDTDSLLIWFPIEHPESKFINTPLMQRVDFEKVPQWFHLNTSDTHKKSGLWSLETDKQVSEFVGLRAKTYALKYTDNTTTCKNKGVIRTAREENNRKPLEFGDYIKCLYHDQEIYVEQLLIRSKKHEISTIKQRKLALSAIDEKRAILADRIHTLPFGYQGELFADASTILPSVDLYT